MSPLISLRPGWASWAPDIAAHFGTSRLIPPRIGRRKSTLTRVEASDIHLFPQLGMFNGHLWAIYGPFMGHNYLPIPCLSCFQTSFPYLQNAVKSGFFSSRSRTKTRRRGIHGRAASPSCWAAFRGDFWGAPEPRNCQKRPDGLVIFITKTYRLKW